MQQQWPNIIESMERDREREFLHDVWLASAGVSKWSVPPLLLLFVIDASNDSNEQSVSKWALQCTGQQQQQQQCCQAETGNRHQHHHFHHPKSLDQRVQSKILRFNCNLIAEMRVRVLSVNSQCPSCDTWNKVAFFFLVFSSFLACLLGDDHRYIFAAVAVAAAVPLLLFLSLSTGHIRLKWWQQWHHQWALLCANDNQPTSQQPVNICLPLKNIKREREREDTKPAGSSAADDEHSLHSRLTNQTKLWCWWFGDLRQWICLLSVNNTLITRKTLMRWRDSNVSGAQQWRPAVPPLLSNGSPTNRDWLFLAISFSVSLIVIVHSRRVSRFLCRTLHTILDFSSVFLFYSRRWIWELFLWFKSSLLIWWRTTVP